MNYEKRTFRKDHFLQLSEEEKEKVFTAIFESKELATATSRRKTIERTLKVLQIQYLPDKKRSGSKYEGQAEKPPDWLQRID